MILAALNTLLRLRSAPFMCVKLLITSTLVNWLEEAHRYSRFLAEANGAIEAIELWVKLMVVSLVNPLRAEIIADIVVSQAEVLQIGQ